MEARTARPIEEHSSAAPTRWLARGGETVSPVGRFRELVRGATLGHQRSTIPARHIAMTDDVRTRPVERCRMVRP
jgi:hypothetical protein